MTELELRSKLIEDAELRQDDKEPPIRWNIDRKKLDWLLNGGMHDLYNEKEGEH